MASRTRSKRLRSNRKMIPIRAQIRPDAASLDQFHPARLVLQRNGFLTKEQLAYLLERSVGKSLPPWLNRYLVDFLRGKTKRPKGRPRRSDPEIDFLLAEHFDWFEHQTKIFAEMPMAKRPTSKTRLKTPRILAAEYLVAHSQSFKIFGFSGRNLHNLFWRFGYLKSRRRFAKQKR